MEHFPSLPRGSVVTTLLATILDSSLLVQNLKVYRSCYLKAIRFHAYKHGSIVGNVRVGVYDGERLISESFITSEQINSIEGTYFHGSIKKEYDNAIFLSVLPSEEYKVFTFKFSLEGGVDDEYNYLAICQDYEKHISNTLDDFKYPPIYGDGSEGGLTTTYANRHPFGVELFLLNRI